MPITREEKTSIQIGHAVWIADNCIPLTDGVECGNCARHCPAGAIIMVPSKKDDPASVKVPVVNTARCIGCGACVAACKNGSAMLFVSAKVSQFALLPQGKVEAARRVRAMVSKMDELGFGNCTNTGACAAQCPKNISLSNIARMNREYLKMKLKD